MDVPELVHVSSPGLRIAFIGEHASHLVTLGGVDSGGQNVYVAELARSLALTAWANDVGYEETFARQIEALGRPGDMLVGIGTSGRSDNVVRAFDKAKSIGIRTLAIVAGDGGILRTMSDEILMVPSRDTQRIQEVHGLLIHVLAELVEVRVVRMEGMMLA